MDGLSVAGNMLAGPQVVSETVRTMRERATRDPNDLEAWVRLAQASVALNLPGESLAAWRKADELAGSPPEIAGPLGEAAVAVANGTVNWSSAGVVTFTPSSNVSGSVSFAYTIRDAGGLTSSATVNGTVTAVADAPTFTALPSEQPGDGRGLVIGLVEALSGFYLPEGFKDIAPYIVVLLMLVLKPNGLFGEKLRKKV